MENRSNGGFQPSEKIVYLDNAATTPCAPEALAAVVEALSGACGNPSSHYSIGYEAKEILDRARAQVAAAIHASPAEIFFTGCGSEADNWAIKGTAFAKRDKGNHIITTAIEHAAVLETCRDLERQGYEVTYLKPDREGRINPQDLAAALRPDTALVSMMLVNNELGTVLPVAQTAKLVHQKTKALVHCDAVQGFLKVPFTPRELGVDLLAVSGHKIHAPKGVGGLYLSDRLVQSFQPPYLGGEQERGLRPGTENLPYALGLEAAARKLAPDLAGRASHIRALNQRLRAGLAAFPTVEINSPADAVPEILNFSENKVKSETMLAWLAEAKIYVSSASACGRGEPSHTLEAMGRPAKAVDTAIRVSFCAGNTEEDVDAFLERFEAGMKQLQGI